MTRPLAATLPLVLILAACSRQPAAVALVDYRDDRTGFSLRHPEGWLRATGTTEMEVRFVPPGAAESKAEFISVFTVPSTAGPSEADVRRQVFGLLAIHGVSGFQQDARTSAEVLWYKFEVTGSTAGTEWASVGVAAAGAMRLQVAVCAKPLGQWRYGQTQCDAVIRSFRPGDLTMQ